ncbi:hypothetical protein [Flavilitoribacter nigricans]|uniref:Uncharacterized protein n=1 Tax=Flavilitoribacter nigricans (strain ATCC 23147 / DSM 23189 / NBRC 102662 / NCIMB 1420 / SS-2) TaxID=1122177 RepID=A0A2D0N0J6_FLAN2|nr:hypothetical protein [Flavilitoribacter nigricans]PHN01987.1 hypothetical protein CRP01_34340 [Flavilitoribacter nigricans DSM 23189 = NBRC 102662]
MKYWLTLFYGFFCPISLLMAQPGQRIILYTGDSPLLLPFIQESLEEMTDVETKKPLFAHVSNLTQVIRDEAAMLGLYDQLLKIAEKEGLNVAFEVFPDTLKKRLIHSLQQHDLFLKVDVTGEYPIQNYYFRLYEIGKGKALIMSSGKGVALERLIIDLTQQFHNALAEDFLLVRQAEGRFKEDIPKLLKGIFPRSHHWPEAVIKVDTGRLNGRIGYRREGNKDEIVLYAAVGDTIFLDAYLSRFQGMPAALDYHWLIQRHSKPDLKLQLHNRGMTCYVIPEETGCFTVELELHDGIKSVDSLGLTHDELKVMATATPKFTVLPQAIYSRAYRRFGELYSKGIASSSEGLLVGDLSGMTFKQIVSGKSMPIELIDPAPDSARFRLQYPGASFYGEVLIEGSTAEGVTNHKAITWLHRVFEPVYFGLSMAQNGITLDPGDTQRQVVRTFLEPKLSLSLHLSDFIDIGLYVPYVKLNWEDQPQGLIQVNALPELEIACRYRRELGSISAIGNLRFLQLNYTDRNEIWSIPGLKVQLGLSLFRGSVDCNFALGMFNWVPRHTLLAGFHEYFSTGFTYHITHKSMTYHDY